MGTKEPASSRRTHRVEISSTFT
ncbi:hypothetical protein RHECNPAF_930087 [Rhizobium etli CNPAF512]|nr:hypothetical protein RHECNPAF_930087 [Rhizobium etli CNPAF512]